jgi:hypothetical protein
VTRRLNTEQMVNGLSNMPSELLFSTLAAVKDESSFLHFAGLLAAEHDEEDDPSGKVDMHKPNWKNQTIEDFLLAANAWNTDAKLAEMPRPRPADLWQLLAKYLLNSRGYD